VPRPAAPDGAGIDRPSVRNRSNTPHPRLAPLATPSPAPRGRGGRGVRGAPKGQARLTPTGTARGRGQGPGDEGCSRGPRTRDRARDARSRSGAGAESTGDRSQKTAPSCGGRDVGHHRDTLPCNRAPGSFV